MKQYSKPYSIGVLIGIFIYLLNLLPPNKIVWSWKIILGLLFIIPGIVYLILIVEDYNQLSLKKDKILKSITFLIGIGIGALGMILFAGYP